MRSRRRMLACRQSVYIYQHTRPRRQQPMAVLTPAGANTRISWVSACPGATSGLEMGAICSCCDCMHICQQHGSVAWVTRTNLWHGRLEVETRERVRTRGNELCEDPDETRTRRRRLWGQRHLQLVLVVRGIARCCRSLCGRGRRGLRDRRRRCRRGCTE